MDQEQQHCEHRLEDVFLLDDEISEPLGVVAAASEDSYPLAEDQSFSYLEDVVAVEQDAAAAAAIMMMDDDDEEEEDASPMFDGMTPTPDSRIT